MRLFVAIYPGSAAIKAWEHFQKTAPRWPVRWLPSASLHITLKFLGEVKPDLEPKITEKLARLAAVAPSFSLDLRAGGVFPPKGAPSIFWAGVGGDTALLSEIATTCELELKTLGIPPEKRAFHPHMTVARPANGQDRLPVAIARDYLAWSAPFSSGPFPVNQFCLVESRLSPSGSAYHVRQSFGLQ